MTRRRPLLIAAALIAFGMAGLSALGLHVGAFQSVQPRLVDNLFPTIGPDPQIAVVMIDDKSLAAVGRWPWDRKIHARLIDALNRRGASRIGYDVTFSESSASDAALAASIRRSGDVVLGENGTFSGKTLDVPTTSTLEQPVEQLGGAALAEGHVNVFRDADGVVRSLAPAIRTADGVLVPSLSLQLALRKPVHTVSLASDGVRTSEGLIPTGPAHLMDVNYADGFSTYSAIDVIDGRTPPNAFKAKIVLVGASASGLGDYSLTPLDKGSGQPGVLIHASALNTILQGAYLNQPSDTNTIVWVLIVSLAVALGVGFLWLWLTPLAPIGTGVVFAWFMLQRFDAGHVTNLVYPTIAIVLSTIIAMGTRYFVEVRERRRVTKIFGRYVSRDVVNEMIAAGDAALASLDGAAPEISVLFADLRGFTSASENLPPADVVRALNAYLDAMTRAVEHERGTVDKFMGDCVMAFWNAPHREPQHAERAVKAALLMQTYIAEAIQRDEVSALKVAGCGVGIATGEAIVGNIGSEARLDYTVIGDTVNTASRLCGVAGGGEVVITDATAQAIGDAFELEALEPVSVKNKKEPLKVFRVRSAHTPSDDAPRRESIGAAGYAPVEPVPAGEKHS